jgi:hypothetical protein
MNTKEVFNTGGWPSVWSNLAEKKLSPKEVASFAEQKARELDGRPPLDPFWLEGEASLKKTNVSEGLRAQTFLSWLNEADIGAWDVERLGFEVMYLNAIKFVDWGMKSDWPEHAGAKTLAEATLFEIQRKEVFDWHWKWGAVRDDWWQMLVEFHPSKIEVPLEVLRQSKDKWGPDELKKVKDLLEVWQEHPRAKSALSIPWIEEEMPLWEKAVLDWKHQSGKSKHKKSL